MNLRVVGATSPRELRGAPAFTLTIRPLSAKATRDCCLEWPTEAGRDSRIDTLLPSLQPHVRASKVTSVIFNKHWTFTEAVKWYLDLKDDMSRGRLELLLWEHGMILTLTQIDEMMAATRKYRWGGLSNKIGVFFTKTRNGRIMPGRVSEKGIILDDMDDYQWAYFRQICTEHRFLFSTRVG